MVEKVGYEDEEKFQECLKNIANLKSYFAFVNENDETDVYQEAIQFLLDGRDELKKKNYDTALNYIEKGGEMIKSYVSENNLEEEFEEYRENLEKRLNNKNDYLFRSVGPIRPIFEE